MNEVFNKISIFKPENDRKCLIPSEFGGLRPVVSEIDNDIIIWKGEYGHKYFAKKEDLWRYANDLEHWKCSVKALEFKHVFGSLLKKKKQTINEWFESLTEIPKEPNISFGSSKASVALTKMLPDLTKSDRKFFTFTYEKMRSDLSTICLGFYEKFSVSIQRSAERIMQTIYHDAQNKAYKHFMFNNIVESDPLQEKAENLFFCILRQEYSTCLKSFKTRIKNKGNKQSE